MSQKKKSTYQTKEVRFGGNKLVLYSLDGVTWSSRKSELHAIQERHEKEKITLNDIKGISPEEGEEAPKEAEEVDPLERELAMEDETESKGPKKRGRAGAVRPKLSSVKFTPVPQQAKAAKAIAAKKPQKGVKSSKVVVAPKKRASSSPASKSSKSRPRKNKAA